MKPLLHPSSILTFWFTLFIISINIQTPLCADNDSKYYTNCYEAFSCDGSSVGNLKYPFWGGNRTEYCGQSQLELVCEDRAAKITINSITYRVVKWEDSTQKLTVARDDFWGGVCAVSDYQNSSFDNSPFQYDFSGDNNVTLLYNCGSIDPPSGFYRSSCDGGSRVVYYIVGVGPLSFASACTSVVVPVLASQVSALASTAGNIDEVLNEGFGLRWSGNYQECTGCLDTRGACGFDGKFRCFCEDGPHQSSCISDRAPAPGKGGSTKVGVIIGVAAGVAVLVGLLCCGFFMFRRKRKMAKQSTGKDLLMPTTTSRPSSFTLTSATNSSQSVSSYPSSTSGTVPPKSFYFGVKVFTYEELEEATNGFHTSRELGEGGFGTVYKGELQDGRVVAVKRHYESNFKRVEQFINEVRILATLRHKNLVTLYGCTSRHSRELLLVYEFISNGTVDDHLHGKRSKSALLPWPVRLNIAVETAEALAYLHANDVIHRDVKSNNILLDDKFHVKVADFGLSRLFPTHVTHVSTAPQGTPGYVDPEYYQCYQLNDKSDVYSFGVVLVELISSLQAVDVSRHRSDVNLANMAINKIQNQELHELVDLDLGFEKDDGVRRMMTGVAELAFRCLQQQKEMRPNMDEAVEILRAIKSDELDTREAKVVDVVTDEVVLLKKVPSPVSPDSVADKWQWGMLRRTT
ncbi:LEAF RUST 10 DISEASE-RESISTANCE LOCUS RECEPTOR-LIKE PROTEIN KINASE-like 1.4 isoform X2 [Lotus japonicus]|uniref:LEAF RUST 10 DISEASE-RESISTANCE LOCUS RECEPTOR-LIKE PROTEIN KINASE-like 1.4 isoform X2 n=1 Tax=Lotus japonicus TaxID=34305 RepID=UPI002584068E|nr:LEAF RUST 10 DISEASE-RESISTANCE LOCUS RECEPTOR-LIKE PROTEIN KINASE-like 1.4 isoform X2 [Lotus japonicus]